MILHTERLTLRPWNEADAEGLFEYAKDPDVGPIAGWPPHKNVEESKDVIKNVLAVDENRVNETGELSVGNKMRYIFSWEWPYESGDDEFDTMLGNLAVDEDVTLTVEINTVAMADEYADGGFKTGDDANIGIYLGAGGVALSVIVFLVIKRRKEEDDEK